MSNLIVDGNRTNGATAEEKVTAKLVQDTQPRWYRRAFAATKRQTKNTVVTLKVLMAMGAEGFMKFAKKALSSEALVRTAVWALTVVAVFLIAFAISSALTPVMVWLASISVILGWIFLALEFIFAYRFGWAVGTFVEDALNSHYRHPGYTSYGYKLAF